MDIKRYTLWSASAALAMLMASPASHAVVSDELLTSSNLTTPWQNCDGSDLIADQTDTFDPAHLEGDGCVYRETPAVASEQYTLTCGVSSFKYSSITLAFLNDAGDTLATQTTEIFEDTEGGSYSVTLPAPAGTTLAAVGIYGLAGSGFQDCTLLLDNPIAIPVDGSIAGSTWFDENSDTLRTTGESPIPSTPVSISSGGVQLGNTVTDLDGNYYFGSLDVDQCYTIQFMTSDPTLTFTATGGDNQAVNNGATLDICLTEQAPNVTGVDSGFVAVPPVVPPEDYAVCGYVFMSEADTTTAVSDVQVALTDVLSGEFLNASSAADGSYSFANLPAGDYKLVFQGPAGFEFVVNGSPLTANGSYADVNGETPQFNLPGDSNTDGDDACTLGNANAQLLRTPVALDPTVANDDEVSGFTGDSLTIAILGNDAPCNGEVDVVDLINHNVPGNVSFNAATGQFEIANTTASGVYSIEYGLRGSCGSYDTAIVTVTLEDVPVPPVANTPDAPASCLASIGKLTGTESGVHVDLKLPQGATHADYFYPQYNFYDAEMNLLFTGFRDAGDEMSANVASWGLYWRKREHGIEVLGIRYVTAVENNLESAMTECTEQKVTPIALDIDTSGQVESIVGKFVFDIDGDGIDDHLAEWFGPNEGILIYKDFGTTISGENLFGDNGGKFTDGFAKLAMEDANQDGQLTGKELARLAVWTDRNSNAAVDDGEISSIDAHTISSISVEHYKYASRAILKNGKSLLMRDVWFGLSPIEQAAR